MGLQAALRQLAELRVFAGLRVGGGCDDCADILFKLIGSDSIVLFIRHTENVFLRGGVELQRNGSVGGCTHIIIDQCPDGAFQAAAAKGFIVGRIPDQRFHQRTLHLVRISLCRPDAAFQA